jgi:hypothetical protein
MAIYKFYIPATVILTFQLYYNYAKFGFPYANANK